MEQEPLTESLVFGFQSEDVAEMRLLSKPPQITGHFPKLLLQVLHVQMLAAQFASEALLHNPTDSWESPLGG